MHEAAERVGVRVRGQLVRAGRPDVGEQVPAAADARTRPVSGRTQQPAPGRRPGPQQRRAAPRSTGYPSLSSGTSPSGDEDAAQPAAHPLIATASSGAGAPAGGPEQAVDVDQVGEHLAVVGGRPLVVAAVGQHLHGQLPGQPVERLVQQPRRRRRTRPARPAP